MELLILLLLYPLFMERKWQKECYKERGEKKCGGVCGGDNITLYMSDMCIDCPYRNGGEKI